MGGLLAVLFYALIFVFFVRASKRKKNAQSSGANRSAAKPAKPVPAPAQTNAGAAPVETAHAAPVEPSRPGAIAQSLTDFTPSPEFIGEGEAPGEHAEHVQIMEAREQARREHFDALDELRQANVDALRRAVILSEILSEPVALREPKH